MKPSQQCMQHVTRNWSGLRQQQTATTNTDINTNTHNNTWNKHYATDGSFSIVLKSTESFKCSLDQVKVTFFRCCNAILYGNYCINSYTFIEVCIIIIINSHTSHYNKI